MMKKTQTGQDYTNFGQFVCFTLAGILWRGMSIYWTFCCWPAELGAVFGKVSPGWPAASSSSEPPVYRAEQSSQPAVLLVQLMDFFFQTKQAAHIIIAIRRNLMSLKKKLLSVQKTLTSFCILYTWSSCLFCFAVPLTVWEWVHHCLWCSRIWV